MRQCIGPNGEVTAYAYDANSNMTSLTTPRGDVTSWEYDGLDRVQSQSVRYGAWTGRPPTFVLGSPHTSTYLYDDNSNLTQKTDRDGRVTTYDYDALNRRTAENWYDDQSTFLQTISYDYDAAGNLHSVSDPSATYTYDYDGLNRQTGVTQSIADLTPAVSFAYGYDAASRQTSAAATIGSTADYVNTYGYNALGELTALTQAAQTGGQAVSAKRLDLSYYADRQLQSATRYASTSQTNIVADSQYGYDAVGRLTSIAHTGDATGSTYANEYDYTYDDASRLATYNNTLDGISTAYSYDADGQLTGADYTGGGTDETYSYTANGDRETVVAYAGELDYDLVDGDRYLQDDQYVYGYDQEGNLVSKLSFGDDSGDVVLYTWDNRNRLIEVDKYDGHGTYDTSDNTLVGGVNYTYDAFNQMVTRLEWQPRAKKGTQLNSRQVDAVRSLLVAQKLVSLLPAGYYTIGHQCSVAI